MPKKMDEFLIKELEFDLRSSDLGTRRHALISLSNMSRSPHIFKLFKRAMSEDAHPEIQYLARKFYNEWRPFFEKQEEPVEAPNVFTGDEFNSKEVKQSFLSKNPRLKLQVIKQLIEKKDERALPLVEEALQKEKEPFVISSLVKAVGAIGDSSHITLLQGFLKHDDSRVRANTVEGLEMIGDDLCFPILVPMLQDPDNRVKANTIKALMRYDEEGAKDLILKLAKSSKEGRRASACFCLHVAEVEWVEEVLMGMIKCEDSIDLLKKECELLGAHGSIDSVGWLANKLEFSSREEGLCYKYALNTLSKKFSLDEQRIAELKESAKGEAAPDVPPTKSEKQEQSIDYDQSSWDMDAIKDILPKKKKKGVSPGPSKAKPLKEKVKKKSSPAVAAASSKSSAMSDGMKYLIPAGVSLLLIIIVSISYMISGGEKVKPKPEKVIAGKEVNLICRVRFVRRKEKTLTLAHGSRTYFARCDEKTDLSGINVRDVVEVSGVLTDERHYGAVVMDCKSIARK